MTVRHRQARNEEQGTRNKERKKNPVDARRPYAYLCEREYAATGEVAQVATVFLTNRECPFQCLMCDLWKNTLDTSVAPGDIPTQIDYALERLPAATQIKLYNSGNFFDRKAIPPSDYEAIARPARPIRAGHRRKSSFAGWRRMPAFR